MQKKTIFSLSREISEKLEEFCFITLYKKSSVVELALREYFRIKEEAERESARTRAAS